MKRLAASATVCLAIGVVISVVLAWACALRRARDFSVFFSTGRAAAKGWPARVPPAWGLPNTWNERHSFGYTGLWVLHTYTGFGTIKTEVQLETSGWPLRCLRATVLYPSDEYDERTELGRVSDFTFNFISWRGGIERVTLLPPASSRTHYLPLEPLWPGLAVDSALYGALVGTAVLGAAAVRRRLRVRARLCANCGYPTGSSAVCSECGRPVTAGAPS